MRVQRVIVGVTLFFLVCTLAASAVVGLGAAVPYEHQVSGERVIPAPCQLAWDALADVRGQAAWRPDLAHVQPTPDRLGQTSWMEYYTRGERMIVTEQYLEPPALLVLGLADDTGPFEGTWTFELTAQGGGCRVKLSEVGRSHNVMFRFVLHYVVGEAAYLERYLDHLQAHLS